LFGLLKKRLKNINKYNILPTKL